MSKAKRNTLVLLGVVGALILILAMSLPTLVLSSGQPFSLGQPQLRPFGVSGAASGGDALVWIIRGIVAIALVLFPLYILYSFMTKEGRQRLIVDVIVLALLFFLANYLQKLPLQEKTEPQEQVAGAPLNADEVSPIPDSVFVATPPIWLTPVVIIIAAIVVVVVLFVGIRVLRRRPSNENSLNQLAEEAQKAIEALETGGNLRNTVIQCYREMMHIVKQQKGIERETAMTVREFEDYLVNSGLPKEAVETLSRLFEQVRYGGAMEDDHQEEIARSCLTDIVDACQVMRGST